MSVSHVLFHNARIWNSGNRDNSWMVIDTDEGIIVDTGKETPPIEAHAPENTRDCEQRRILPGIHDSHLHVSYIGDAMNSVDLQNSSSIEDFQSSLGYFHAAHSEARCLRGRGWEQDLLGRYPTRADVDAVVSDKPVRLYRICAHIALVNSVTLKLAGITKDTPAPYGGSIDKYPPGHAEEGEPSGILRETAVDMVAELFTLSEEENIKNIQDGLQKCLEYGITSVHTNEPDIWREYCLLADQGRLPIRVFFCCYYRFRHKEGFPIPGESHGPLLSCDRVKIFLDGAIGSSTAAISEPYVGTTNKGMMLHTQEELNYLVSEANGQGFRLEIHVIGDRAAEAALDAIEKATVPKEKRPILTHCQILRSDLIIRMKELGVIANIQPQFVTKDSTWLHERLPSKLLDKAYVWKTLLSEGIHCSGGSDAPVEEPNPFLGIYDAIYRPLGKRYPNPTPEDMMSPEECLSMQQAVDLYTINGAYTTMAEGRLGSLQEGYQADFVVVNSETDVCENPKELLHAAPEEVWVMGKRKYNRKDL